MGPIVWLLWKWTKMCLCNAESVSASFLHSQQSVPSPSGCSGDMFNDLPSSLLKLSATCLAQFYKQDRIFPSSQVQYLWHFCDLPHLYTPTITLNVYYGSFSPFLSTACFPTLLQMANKNEWKGGLLVIHHSQFTN